MVVGSCRVASGSLKPMIGLSLRTHFFRRHSHSMSELFCEEVRLVRLDERNERVAVLSRSTVYVVVFLVKLVQLVDLRENLDETPIVHGNIYGFLWILP